MNMGNLDFKNIKEIIPQAVQNGNISGIRVIVQIYPSEGEPYFSFLIPPDYFNIDLIPDYIVKSAIIKYGFLPIEEKISITSPEKLESFIQSFKKDSSIV